MYIIKCLDRILSFEQLLWGAPICMTAHNLEEVLRSNDLVRLGERLPPRFGVMRPFLFAGSVRRFRVLATLLTFGTWTLAAVATLGDRRDASAKLLLGVQEGLLVSALVPHLALSICCRRYTPGVATALLLNVPFALYLFHRAGRVDA